jgi:TDG/mug DNA glycosylase family protein
VSGKTSAGPRAGAGGLRDIIVERPRLLLIGINPSLYSAEVGHHFASPGNPFWRLLFASGLIPEPITATDDARLAEFGIALSNLCPRPTRSAAELRPREIDEGIAVLGRKIERIKPKVVAFVGLSLYKDYFHLKVSGGAGEKRETIAGARVFVVPNPSGLNASFPGFSHKLVWFRALAEYIGAGTRSKGSRPRKQSVD